jgi:uncharacterized protein
VSFGIDVNICLFAADPSSPLNPKAVSFLEQCARDRQVFSIAWLNLMSYLRIATYPSIFDRPLSHDEAVRNVDSLLALPHCRVIREEEIFWPAYQEITAEVPTRGILVPDAHLAAVLRGHDVKTLYTHDRDFRKFVRSDNQDERLATHWLEPTGVTIKEIRWPIGPTQYYGIGFTGFGQTTTKHWHQFVQGLCMPIKAMLDRLESLAAILRELAEAARFAIAAASARSSQGQPGASHPTPMQVDVTAGD